MRYYAIFGTLIHDVVSYARNMSNGVRLPWNMRMMHPAFC